MKPETIVARKTILLSNNLKPETTEMSAELLKAARGVAQKWKLAPEEQHKLKEKSEAEKMIRVISSDIDKLKVKSTQMRRTIDLLEKEFVESVQTGEKNNDMAFVTKGIALKRKCEEHKSDLAILEKEVLNLIEKRKKLSS